MANELDRIDGNTLSAVKDLAEGASIQIKATNRYWLVLIAISLFVLIPLPSIDATQRTLPFSLGEVEVGTFNTVSTYMLAVLIIAFCQAHAQAIRATLLGQRMLDKMPNEIQPIGISPRDLYDVFRLPSLVRVAPLAELIKGKYQFSLDESKCPQLLRKITAMLYLFFKVVATAVYLVLPAIALGTAVAASGTTDLLRIPGWIVYVFSFVATVAFLIVFIVDLFYIYVTFRRYWGK